MRITPIDIRQQHFAVRFRGFDPQEVDAFLEDVAEDYEALMRENGLLKEQLASLEERSRGVSDREKVLQDTLVMTQQMSEQIKENARREAEALVREAHAQRDRALQDIEADAGRVRADLSNLKRLRHELIENLKSTVESYQRLLETDLKDEGPEE
jgi:cell division initiation protein